MTETEQTAPCAIESEQALLGCLITNPEAAMGELQFKVIPEMFYDIRNRIIWNTAVKLSGEGLIPDASAIASELANRDFEIPITVAFLQDLTNRSVSFHNWPWYVEDLRNALIHRKQLQFCGDFTLRIRDNPRSVLLDEFETQALAIRKTADKSTGLVDVPKTISSIITDYEDAIATKKIPGLKTGFIDLDAIVGGLHPQQLILIAGSPSAGKTSLALNIAVRIIQRESITVGMLSLETSARKILHRLNCCIARVDGAPFLNGKPLERHLTKLMSSMNRIMTVGKRLKLYDESGLSAPQAASIMRMMYSQGARLFIVDYLQLLSSGEKHSKRVEEMTAVSKMLKGICKELNCPVIAISSINREAQRNNRKPQLSDLRETGQLEFDADIVLLLHALDDRNDARSIDINVAKNKDGATGHCTLILVPSEFAFDDISHVNQTDLPD